MAAQKNQKKHLSSIVVAHPPTYIFEIVKKLAEKEKRSNGKQAEWMLEQYIKEHKL